MYKQHRGLRRPIDTLRRASAGLVFWLVCAAWRCQAVTAAPTLNTPIKQPAVFHYSRVAVPFSQFCDVPAGQLSKLDGGTMAAQSPAGALAIKRSFERLDAIAKTV